MTFAAATEGGGGGAGACAVLFAQEIAAMVSTTITEIEVRCRFVGMVQVIILAPPANATPLRCHGIFQGQ